MIVTSTLTPRNGSMIAGEHSLRLPMIAPKDEVCGPSTPPGSTAPRATSLSIPTPRMRLPSRSRTGCWTCRSRKVKCDESHPSCGQCARLGHRCDYSPRLTFRDDTSRIVERMTEVSVTGNAVWDSKARIHSPPATPGVYDSLPPFFMLTSDDEREKKAESSYPGTYHVIVNPESFSNLPEYSDESSSVDLNIGRLRIRRSSGTSSTPSELRSNHELNDPNTVVLDCFEDSNHRSPVLNGAKARLSPASDITCTSTLASPTFPPHHNALALSITASNSSQEDLLLVHFRDVVWKQLLQGQSSHELFSPISSPVTPGVEVFEDLASTFQPLYHAVMAVSALSLARQYRSKSIDALQHYHQAFPSLQTALRDTNDLCSDGLFLTHFLLLIYEVAAAEEGGSNLWSHHMSRLLQISLMRVSTFGSERYPYVVWLVCNIDLYALLSGAGTGEFLKAMLDNDLLPSCESQLYPVAPSGHSVIYPEEHETLPSVLQINHETFIFATRLALLAVEIRQKGLYYNVPPSSPHLVDAKRRLYEIRNSFHHLWDCPQARYLCENMEALPQRSRELLQNAVTLYHSCMIYSYTNLWHGQLLGPEGASDEIITHHTTRIFQIAEAIVHSNQFDLRFIVFPLFIAGVSTSSAGQKMMALDLVSSLEKYGIGRNATTTRHLLQMVYQAQTEQLMAIGHSANVEWADVMVQQGMQIVNFGLVNRLHITHPSTDILVTTTTASPQSRFELAPPRNPAKLAMSPTNSNNHYGRPDEEMFLNHSATSRQDGDESPIVGPLRINKPPSTAPTPQPATATSLPYPDDRPRPQKSQSPASQTHYPEPNSRIASPAQSTSSGDYPAALRPREGREPKPSLAERRGNAPPKPLPESPGPETPDKDALFQKFPPPGPPRAAPGETNNAQSNQQYFPPPSAATAAPARLKASNPASINRISSTASNSTTRAQRGSPPPPETPIVGPGQRPGADIEARFAAAGIAGTSTLSSLQARNAAAQQRANQYAGQTETQRPWTPTEQPGTQPHGPPTVYQGSTEIGTQQYIPPAPTQPAPQQGPPPPNPADRPVIPPNALEQDFQRMNLSSSPPPAYSTVPGANASQSYPNDKARPAAASPAPPQGHPASFVAPSVAGSAASAAAGIAPISSPAPSVQSHPAFANDPRQQPQQLPQSQTPIQQQQQQQQQPQQVLSPQQGYPAGVINEQSAPSVASPTSSAYPPASPPPLPEGWIAHLDPNSGQYYYIHLPTQSTQWEFPKGPTPLNMNETPLSPVGSIYSAHPLTSPAFSTFGGKPLASPGVPMTPMYEGSVMGLSTVGTAVTGPPPSSGVELYKVAATNGVYFGPYLRYCNMDLERGLWLGSILLVTDAPQPPTIHIHQSVDLSPNPRQLKGVNISQHQRWVFYKYDIDLQMEDSGPAKWTYAITSHLGCTRYEFLVAGRHETNWRFIATSGNDFSLNVNANERARLGGVGFMWKDIMQKYAEVGGFHCQLGLGGQISADRVWKEIPLLKQWLGIHGKDQRKNSPWTTAHEEEVSHAFFHYYTSHFDQPYLREAFAQIPHILQLDDHDIFDGFGSYPQHMQFSNVFKNIGRIGIEMYLLFQHHTTVELLRNMSTDHDLFTITGTGWHFVKYLGPAVAVIGPDCRSERNPHQVMAGPTYQGLFPKVALLPPSVQHCIWLSPVPLIYPRLDSTEQIANAVATGKKAVTGAYNLLGKVTSSVAGVVGAKDAVGSGFDAVKRAVGKNGLMGSVLNPFGEIDLLDEFRDQWTHESKDLERTYLIRTLQGIAKQKSLRITFLSGAVNVCGAGLVHDPSHPSDHKTMYQLITSPVVNTPPSAYILKLLHNNKPLYLPANGQRSTPSQPTDTKEDMLELFQTDVTGQPREYRRLMGRRNYVAIVAYDPEVVAGTFGQTDIQRGGGKLSLAADFMVQGEGAYGSVVKYGPVIIPNLAYGQ